MGGALHRVPCLVRASAVAAGVQRDLAVGDWRNTVPLREALGCLSLQGETHPLAAGADNFANMRRLLWTLASMDCLAATWLIAAGEKHSAARLLSRAAELLDTRGRSRDDDEPWRPMLATPWIGGE